MLREILPEEARESVARERELLARIHEFVEEFEPGGADAARVRELIEHLDDMFLLVVVGEVKAGKSAFINALLDYDACPEGPLPLTDKVHVLGHGETRDEASPEPDVVRHALPLDGLRRMNVVDTPGTNSPLKRHQEITEAFLPRADIVFFVTSIDCPLTQTELQLLGDIRRRWNKEIACILAKVDIHPERDRQVVLEYLDGQFQEHLGYAPAIFPVSSHQARKAREAGDADAFEKSGFAAVERYIVENLGESRRILLKLKSPLGTVSDLLGTIDRQAAARLEMLEKDFAGWNRIQEQVDFAATSLRERAERHLAPVSVAFENLEARGRRYLREVFRLKHLRQLSDAGAFRQQFENEVVRGAVEEIEAKVEDAARWLAKETRALWERSLSHFQETVALQRYRGDIPSGAGPQFEETRRETLDQLVADARKALDGWSVEGEVARIRELARASLARVLGTELAAAGLGAAVAATLMPTLLGGVGLALAGAVALGGLFLLPARRQRAIENFEAGVRATREAVLASVREAIRAEAGRAAAAILDAFAPFHDFYESRRRTLRAVRERAAAFRDEVRAFQAGLE